MPRQYNTLEEDLNQLSISPTNTSTNDNNWTDTSSIGTSSHSSFSFAADPNHQSPTKDRKVRLIPQQSTVEPKPQSPPPDPLEEYFVQQTKLFRHLEKRYKQFQKKAKDEQERARKNRQAKKGRQNKATTTTTTTTTTAKPPSTAVNAAPSARKKKDNSKGLPSPTPATTSTQKQPDENNTMIGTGVSAIRGQAARAVSQAAVRPAAVIVARAPISPSASFSTSSTSSARQKDLKKKKKRVVNPDAMPAVEAARVLRALEIANPSSSFSLTLTTKTHKSSLPIRGTFQLPLDPRRSSEIILVFAEPSSPSFQLAKEAGAAHVGGEEIFDAVLSGKISPTRCLATPSMMPSVSRSLARYLGPKGLMPVAKRGLVGEGEELVEKIRGAAGRMEYRADKEGLVRVPVARVDFDVPAVENNIRSFIQTVRDDQSSNNTDDALTAAAKKKKKGSAIVGVRLETTNGPSIELNDVL
ncbi:hypothetical protein CI109_105269 [Kwoniella shandongensis]|uniref:Uncharacterized protein n=1 Tax=Kwoniella shandongensis TaxID=1734106 RepID=A0A5M6C3H9_9TREE|nr:uncharacterized protein CI109_002112 [Kwoniella shandongensis]KAA5529686.1 hypothetical protein CI109_002112 [Kwoniella shandongensis]